MKFPGLQRHGNQWRFRVSDGGKMVWVTVPREYQIKTDAGRWMMRYKGKEQKTLPRKVTFKELADERFGDWKQRESTLDLHNNNLHYYLRAIWGTRVQNLDENILVTRVIQPMDTAGLSGNTIHNALMTVSVVMELGIRKHIIERNPVKTLLREEKPSREIKKQHRILTPDEFWLLLRQWRDINERAIFACGGLTGLRISEVLGLTWDSVDFKNDCIHVSFQLEKEGQKLLPLKASGSAGKVDMPQSLRKFLRLMWQRRTLNGLGPCHPSPLSAEAGSHPMEEGGSLVEHVGAQSLAPDLTKGVEASRDVVDGATPRGGIRGHDLVFLTRANSPYGQRNVQRALKNACERAGLQPPWPTFHDLRHTYASALISACSEDTGGLVRVSRQLRHSSPTITLNTYAHLWEERNRTGASGAVIDRLFGEAR